MIDSREARYDAIRQAMKSLNGMGQGWQVGITDAGNITYPVTVTTSLRGYHFIVSSPEAELTEDELEVIIDEYWAQWSRQYDISPAEFTERYAAIIEAEELGCRFTAENEIDKVTVEHDRQNIIIRIWYEDGAGSQHVITKSALEEAAK